jgi:hypothetical protein
MLFYSYKILMLLFVAMVAMVTPALLETLLVPRLPSIERLSAAGALGGAVILASSDRMPGTQWNFSGTGRMIWMTFGPTYTWLSG